MILMMGCNSLFPARLGQYQYTRHETYSGKSHEIRIWVDKNFGDGDIIEINKAVEQWNYALNGYLKLRIESINFDMSVSEIQRQMALGGWLVMKIDSSSSLIPVSGGGSWVLGFVNKLGGDHLYIVRDRMGNSDIFGVMMHEIGHLLGLKHMGERLMRSRYGRAEFQCIDYETIFRLVVKWKFPIEGLNYCVDN